MRGLILSAGLGERLRPLTFVQAKPAIEFLNVPMLTFPYHWLASMGLSDLAFNTHHLPETVRHAAMHVCDPKIALHFTHESAILGSGGGIGNARVYLEGSRTFAVANGDGVVLPEDERLFERMREYHERNGALATLLVCPLEGVGTRLPGVWVNARGEVTHFGKEPRPGLECLHFASYTLFDERLWPHLPEGSSNILYDILEPRIRAGDKVLAYRDERLRWFETGNRADYLKATKICLDLLAEPTHRAGRNLRALLEAHGPAWGAQSDLGAGHLIADTASVHPSAALKGFCVLGPNARVGAYARLENSVALSGAHVEADAIHREDVIAAAPPPA